MSHIQRVMIVCDVAMNSRSIEVNKTMLFLYHPCFLSTMNLHVQFELMKDQIWNREETGVHTQ